MTCSNCNDCAACGAQNGKLEDEVEKLRAEIAALKKALAESPLAAEMWKQMPNAMRLHTAATDRASKLVAAVARWAEHDRGDPLPALRHDAELLEAYEAFTSPEPDGGG